MFSLDRVQRNFIDAINNGPDNIVIEIFSGPVDRVILGLRAHANSISHARRLAIEQCFPRTAQQMGAELFNDAARAYAETGTARKSGNNDIGEQFPAFLQSLNLDIHTVDLARIEWAWRQSYLAADSIAQSLADLANFTKAALLTHKVAWHPATFLVAVDGGIPAALPELAAATDAVAILIVRPDAQVRLLALDHGTAQIARAAEKSVTIGDLLTLANKLGGKAAPIERLLTLIEAGALVAA